MRAQSSGRGTVQASSGLPVTSQHTIGDTARPHDAQRSSLAVAPSISCHGLKLCPMKLLPFLLFSSQALLQRLVTVFGAVDVQTSEKSKRQGRFDCQSIDIIAYLAQPSLIQRRRFFTAGQGSNAFPVQGEERMAVFILDAGHGLHVCQSQEVRQTMISSFLHSSELTLLNEQHRSFARDVIHHMSKSMTTEQGSGFTEVRDDSWRCGCISISFFDDGFRIPSRASGVSSYDWPIAFNNRSLNLYGRTMGAKKSGRYESGKHFWDPRDTNQDAGQSGPCRIFLVHPTLWMGRRNTSLPLCRPTDLTLSSR